MADKKKKNAVEGTATELAAKSKELKKELFDLRFQNSTRQLGNPMEIRQKRKEIARTLTAHTAAKRAG
jgi:large subunit ribosomal protein L29